MAQVVAQPTFTEGQLWILQTTEGEEEYRVEAGPDNLGHIKIKRLGCNTPIWVNPAKLTLIERLFP